MQPQQPNQQQLQVKADDSTLRGAYANNMQVAHTKEEFIIDFMNLFPPVATLNARVIVSPGHMKRMLAVLTENVKHYEEAFGQIEAATSPDSEMGFKTA
ncbi:DUF3467 domain-containing protein [Patescibacteria group bacterium]|nr:DUF3467 domain-containing protein [Patescibacteria group bacterium]MBU1029269.1 DUF3467 domain-containing protein [Patescibacteria group bacterium]MBU1916346.1 DUF3467 domain-containing protein [Patescibacteria group bacterium]